MHAYPISNSLVIFMRRSVAGLAAGAILGAATERAEAAVMHSATSLPGEAYIQYGVQASLGRTVWISAKTLTGQILYFTGGRKDGWNILTINPIIHSSRGPLHVLQVGNGSNYLTDPGVVVNVSDVVLHPSLDFSILHLDQFLPGQDLLLGQAPGFRAPVRIGGYGEHALVNGDIQRQDGNIRAFDMAMGLHDSTFVSGSVQGSLSLPGGALGGYSGAFVEDPNTGMAFGTLRSASLTTNSIQTTNYTPLDTTFIAQNIKTPLPILTIAGVGATKHLTWDAAATGYRLQTSDDLASWSNLGDILTGAGTYDDPVADRPRRFYRLAKTP